jgi:hypothetical protein
MESVCVIGLFRSVSVCVIGLSSMAQPIYHVVPYVQGWCVKYEFETAFRTGEKLRARIKNFKCPAGSLQTLFLYRIAESLCFGHGRSGRCKHLAPRTWPLAPLSNLPIQVFGRY